MKKTIMITMIPVGGWAYLKVMAYVATIMVGGAV